MERGEGRRRGSRAPWQCFSQIYSVSALAAYLLSHLNIQACTHVRVVQAGTSSTRLTRFTSELFMMLPAVKRTSFLVRKDDLSISKSFPPISVYLSCWIYLFILIFLSISLCLFYESVYLSLFPVSLYLSFSISIINVFFLSLSIACAPISVYVCCWTTLFLSLCLSFWMSFFLSHISVPFSLVPNVYRSISRLLFPKCTYS